MRKGPLGAPIPSNFLGFSCSVSLAKQQSSTSNYHFDIVKKIENMALAVVGGLIYCKGYKLVSGKRNLHFCSKFISQIGSNFTYLMVSEKVRGWYCSSLFAIIFQKWGHMGAFLQWNVQNQPHYGEILEKN